MDSKKKGNDKYQAQAKEALQSIVIGEAIFYGGLTVFPLRFSQPSTPDHIVLEDALASGVVEITEISEGGDVPELLLINKGNQSLLLLDGEELVGAKQNRIINISILIAAHVKLKIPVSCVEAGRWDYRSRSFDAGAFAPPSMRSRTKVETMSSIREQQTYRSDQRRVWHDVHCMQDDLGTRSASSAMSDTFNTLAGELEKYEKCLRLPDDASGYIACIGDRVLGGDVFARSDVLAKKWSRLLRGIAVESLRSKGKNAAADITIAKKFIEVAVASIAEAYSPPGVGTGVHIDGVDVIGNVLIANDAVVHAAIFSRK